MTLKQPDKTRQTILEAAFWEMFRNGYQAASIDQILTGTGLTKGALYHHFPNKRELGYAVVDELIRVWMLERWLAPFQEIDNPVDALQQGWRAALDDAPDEIVMGGCPLNNLAQEMSSVDEEFRTRIERVLIDWRDGIARHLERGQREGTVRTDLDPEATACYIVASFEGIAGVTKAARSRDVAERMFDVFAKMLETLRPAGSATEVGVTS